MQVQDYPEYPLCPTFADIPFAIRALTSLNMSNSGLGAYYDDDKDEWISDMSGIKALAAAIPECK